ncbi:MAG: protein kinase [Streptosporangiaceae bacterium]
MLGLQPGDPDRIGPYLLLGRLGHAGMGLMFLGQSADGRPVAVKVLRPDLAADSDFRARFQGEVIAARKVSGPFTAEVVDADAAGPQPWLAMAYEAGPSLAEVVREGGPLPVRSLITLAAGLAAGLCATRAAGLVHGDLKPANVLMAEDGPRMIDFGNSLAAEPSADVFGLGLVLAFAATGRQPFITGKPTAPADRVAHGWPDLDGVPDEIRALVERCLAQDPGQRPTPADLAAEIESGLAPWVEATRPDLPAMTTPAMTTPAISAPAISAPPGPEAAPDALVKARPPARRIWLAAGAVAAAVAVTLIVATSAGHADQPQDAPQRAHPALDHRSAWPTPTPVRLAAWSAGQRIGHAEPFTSISCPATTFCLAADSGGDVYTYSGGRWAGPLPLASGALTSVSCATTTFCAATGANGRADIYTDGSWSGPTQLTGADGNPADLKWVSCPLAGFCVAAGKWDAYTYSAGRWATGYQLQQSYTFASISCPAATFCLAADSGGNVYTYSGGLWAGPRPLASSALTSVSCATTTFCAATGANGRAYVYTDGRWSAPSQLTDADGNRADLRSVSCPAAGFCVTTGRWDAYTYSAGTWAAGHFIQKDQIFTSISCPGAAFCMATDTGGNIYTYSAG